MDEQYYTTTTTTCSNSSATVSQASSASSPQPPSLLKQQQQQQPAVPKRRRPVSDNPEIRQRKAEQNRLAQKAFRERKDLRIKELEVKVALLSQGTALPLPPTANVTDVLLQKIRELESKVSALQNENAELKKLDAVATAAAAASTTKFVATGKESVLSTLSFSLSPEMHSLLPPLSAILHCVRDNTGMIVGSSGDMIDLSEFNHMPSPSSSSEYA
ncbi:hypothetical protein HK100_001833 [Physocladia obscura]|uniref:BZIP domain-containing protein n=1 Tax=Physocladia obscura TaxID=109957 RepID=A0AAD5SWJ9_9FUNG|nr:hypothetical protein HK100_001833 [Physocladia obscura]